MHAEFCKRLHRKPAFPLGLPQSAHGNRRVLDTDQLGKAVMQRKRVGLDTPEHLLRHISPLGWEHILLIGQYIWRKMRGEIA